MSVETSDLNVATANMTRSIANGVAQASLSDSEAWAAVLRRDQRFDGLFVTAVLTTGIYCRPSCPARHPFRRNVVFYQSGKEARQEGFRPCLRCEPDRTAASSNQQIVEHAREYLDRHLDTRVTLHELADEVGFSPSHVQRVFKRHVGLSPKDYQNARRLERFKQHVGEDCEVLEATFAAGFGSSRALYEQAESGLGMTPGTYRRGGKGLSIRYTILPSALGDLLVAATERGVCAVFLGDEEEELAHQLREEFPNAATLERDDRTLRRWAEPVVAYVGGAVVDLRVPVDLQGTSFQRRVWRALQQIPYGETRSYSQVAEMLGNAGSTRAVASACARNKAALVVPCHRVVRKDGSPGGYRWNTDRKKRLLEQERNGRSTDAATR